MFEWWWSLINIFLHQSDLLDYSASLKVSLTVFINGVRDKFGGVALRPHGQCDWIISWFENSSIWLGRRLCGDGQEFSWYLISRESASLILSRTLRTFKWNYHIVSFSENTFTKRSNLRMGLFLLGRHSSYKYFFPPDQNMPLQWFSD